MCGVLQRVCTAQSSAVQVLGADLETQEPKGAVKLTWTFLHEGKKGQN